MYPVGQRKWQLQHNTTQQQTRLQICHMLHTHTQTLMFYFCKCKCKHTSVFANTNLQISVKWENEWMRKMAEGEALKKRDRDEWISVKCNMFKALSPIKAMQYLTELLGGALIESKWERERAIDKDKHVRKLGQRPRRNS